MENEAVSTDWHSSDDMPFMVVDHRILPPLCPPPPQAELVVEHSLDIGPFVEIPNWLISEYSGLAGPSAWLVYCMICSCSDGEGATVSHAELMRLSGLSTNTVRAAVKHLVAIGLVSVGSTYYYDGGRMANRYTVLTPPRLQVAP